MKNTCYIRIFFLHGPYYSGLKTLNFNVFVLKTIYKVAKPLYTHLIT